MITRRTAIAAAVAALAEPEIMFLGREVKLLGAVLETPPPDDWLAALRGDFVPIEDYADVKSIHQGEIGLIDRITIIST